MREWDMPEERKRDVRKPEKFNSACVTIFALVIGVAVSCFIFWAFQNTMNDVTRFVNEHTKSEAPELPEVNDIPYAPEKESASSYSADVARKYKMPLYLQTQQSWSEVPYGSNTIGISGCGLTCAAMTVEWFTGERCTPFDLVNQVGNDCMVYADDGTLVNDMELFGNYLSEKYGFEVSEQYWNVKRALAEVNNDWAQSVVWAGVYGQLGGEWYDGHIVLIWKVTDDAVYIRDPFNEENSNTAFSIADVVSDESAFTYFYTVKEV